MQGVISDEDGDELMTWQPMSTAPREHGATILVLNSVGLIQIVHYCDFAEFEGTDTVGGWSTDLDGDAYGLVTPDDDQYGNKRFLAWHPLPELGEREKELVRFSRDIWAWLPIE